MRALLLATLLCATSVALAVPVSGVPSPPPGSWVSDPSGALRPDVEAQVERIARDADVTGDGQLAVAVIDSTGGELPRAYGTELFNRWGVGHADRNDGVLLLIALDDRKAEIILGRGIDSPLHTERTDRIMREDVEPRMRRADVNGAVLQSVTALRSFLAWAARQNAGAGNAALAQAPGTAAISGSADSSAGGFALWPVWLCGVLVLLGVGGPVLKRALRWRPRRCEKCGRPRVRLDETKEDAFLDRGERTEEAIHSVDYDVWYCSKCDTALVLPYERWFSGRQRCRNCGYRTATSRTVTVETAPPLYGGQVEVTESCANCGAKKRQRRHTSALPYLPPSNSGPGGFGGGSSAGGGSSGSW